MNFISFDLDMPFYLLRSLYKMSKRYKIKGFDSSLFHHGLVKILLMHHLSTIGDNWEVFLIINGFAQIDLTVNPRLTENPSLYKVVVKYQVDIPISEPEFIEKNPIDEGMLCKFPPAFFPKKEVEELKENNPLVHVNDVGVNTDFKKHCRERNRQCTTSNFKGKNIGRLILGKIRNKMDPHLSSIDTIEINEGSNPKIEDFLVQEVPKL
jgi:hypothetical protein